VIIRSKLVRALIGVAVIGLILVMLNSWWGEYRAASQASARSTSPTSSPNPATTITPAKALVLTDGLNLRAKPDVTSNSIRGLKRGETLVVVGQSGTWAQVRDSGGTMGWVTNNPQYLKIQK
jgi:uncharacterized protein YgiM (DUF1202 family)